MGQQAKTPHLVPPHKSRFSFSRLKRVMRKNDRFGGDNSPVDAFKEIGSFIRSLPLRSLQNRPTPDHAHAAPKLSVPLNASNSQVLSSALSSRTTQRGHDMSRLLDASVEDTCRAMGRRVKYNRKGQEKAEAA